MLIAARNAIIAGGAALPYDKRVEWIACDTSTKGAYVTTGITNENGIRCLARVKCPRLSGKATPIGSVVFCGSTRFDVNFITPDYSSSQVRIQYMWHSGGEGQGYYQQISAPADEFFDMDCSIFSGKQKLIINNTVKANYTFALTSYSLDGSEIRMFNYHSPNSDRYAYNSIASLKLLNAQDEVLFDGIPCVKNEEPGFYDLVAGVFHGNSGTGSLIAGPDASAANGGGV